MGMPIFKKRSPELVDLTELRRKGILQRSEIIANENKEFNKNEDIVDLTVRRQSMITPSIVQQQSPPSGEMPNLGDFLSNLAQSNSSQESGIQTSPLSSAMLNREGKIDEIKVKLDDLEFKLNNFINRLERVEEKLGKNKN